MILVISQFCISVLASIGLANLLLKIKEKFSFNMILLSSGGVLITSILWYLFHDFSAHHIQNNIINSHRISMIGRDVIMIASILTIFIVAVWLLIRDKINKNIFGLAIIAVTVFDIGIVNKRIINPSDK